MASTSSRSVSRSTAMRSSKGHPSVLGGKVSTSRVAASSTLNWPAPAPTSGAAITPSSQSAARCQADCNPRRTTSRPTPESGSRITTWSTKGAGRSPPPVTTAAPAFSGVLRRRCSAKRGPACSSRREMVSVRAARVSSVGRRTASASIRARSSTLTRITGRQALALGDTSPVPGPAGTYGRAHGPSGDRPSHRRGRPEVLVPPRPALQRDPPADSANRRGSSKSWRCQVGIRVPDENRLQPPALARAATGAAPARIGPARVRGEVEGPGGGPHRLLDSAAGDQEWSLEAPETRFDRALASILPRARRPPRWPPPAGPEVGRNAVDPRCGPAPARAARDNSGLPVREGNQRPTHRPAGGAAPSDSNPATERRRRSRFPRWRGACRYLPPFKLRMLNGRWVSRESPVRHCSPQSRRPHSTDKSVRPDKLATEDYRLATPFH